MKRFIETAVFLAAVNFLPLGNMFPEAKLFIILISIVFILWECFRRGGKNAANSRLRRIDRGADLIAVGGISAAAEAFFLIFFLAKTPENLAFKILAVILPLLSIGFALFSGVVRIAAGSKQIKISDHAAMIFLWWLPVVNIFIIRKFYKTARREYIFETDKLELEESRAENEICHTKYPVLMVHGIFFRDWQLMNYWGRIPASLKRNGAVVYYGKQQSAQSVADSAEEIKDTIMQVLQETGAEKVNIIAHSKGGLDSRYAISKLGMDKYTATLTTINTPHKGCDMVDYLLGKLPESFKDFLASRYNRIFTVLGDKAPDFMAGVNDLSAIAAKDYDEIMPDMKGVSYRSCMSVMSSSDSAGFPLNIGYILIKKLNGRNDGLVWEESAKHGERYRLVETSGKRGVSHGDVIDLFRENIDGYDVREFYVSLVKELKDEGY